MAVGAEYVVKGQRVAPVKVERSRALRREMTPAERLLWERLRRKQALAVRFRRQQVIDGFIVDFYCHAAGLVVEVDGAVRAAQPEYDAERDRSLAARGLRILRVSNDEVREDIEGVLARIGGAVVGPPPPEPKPTPETGTTGSPFPPAGERGLGGEGF
jgi:very-short-patch-repair endonuclease